jgi:hypothetical protein
MVGVDGGATGRGDRGQALTLEAVTAALLLLVALGFALQMTAVTPLSASTSSQHLENQLESTGEGVLASTADSGALREAVLFWNRSESEFHNTTQEPYYRAGAPPNEFGDVLDEVFGSRNIAYNVIIHYETGDGGVATQRMIYQGRPSDHAISASRTVELTKQNRIVRENGSRGPTLDSLADDEFYAEPGVGADGDPLHYNLVRVEVIAWRI